MTEQRRRTKILATLGPATDAPGVLDCVRVSMWFD
jgi:pyruvate kinase